MEPQTDAASTTSERRDTLPPTLPTAPRAIAPSAPGAQASPAQPAPPPAVQMLDRVGEIVGILVVARLAEHHIIAGEIALLGILGILGVQTGLRQIGARGAAAAAAAVSVGAIGLALMRITPTLVVAAHTAARVRGIALLALALLVGNVPPRA